jgi:hypothetical protein
VDITYCGYYILWILHTVDITYCGYYILWILRTVAITYCGYYILWILRTVDIIYCGYYILWLLHAVDIISIFINYLYLTFKKIENVCTVFKNIFRPVVITLYTIHIFLMYCSTPIVRINWDCEPSG